MNIKKKITAAFIFVSLCIMTLGAISVSALDITSDMLLYEKSGNEIIIAGYSGSETSIVIPDYIENLPVTSIKSRAFLGTSDGKTIESVIIGSNVKTIGSNAFYGCENLKSIVIPNSVTSIESYAFNKCTALTDVTLSNQIKAIKEYTFGRCSSLKSIAIPDGVKSIGERAFYECSSLESIDIPNSVESIGSAAFYMCSSLKSVIIPDSVKTMGEYVFRECKKLKTAKLSKNLTRIEREAFDRCDSLESIVIPDGVTSIGNYAFGYCPGLKSVIISDSVTTLGESAFYECESLKTVILSKNLTSIEMDTFYKCSSLESIIIPDGVKSIGYYAFWGCSDLKSIVIPKSVKTVRDGVFYNCSGLTTVNYTGSEVDKNKINIGVNNDVLDSDDIMNYNYSGALTETLLADSTESSITTTSQAFLINQPEEVKAFGTIFIPLSLYSVGSTDTAIVSYDNSKYNIEDRQKYEATLTYIPEECKDWGIVAISFIQSGDDVSYSTAKYMSVNNTTLESATTATE